MPFVVALDQDGSGQAQQGGGDTDQGDRPALVDSKNTVGAATTLIAHVRAKGPPRSFRFDGPPQCALTLDHGHVVGRLLSVLAVLAALTARRQPMSAASIVSG